MKTDNRQTTYSDERIVKAMRKSPEEGFRLLMGKYREPVYWHIRRLVVVHDDAQDAAQEAFVRIFRSFDTFRGDCSLGSWIYRIATNEALRAAERNKEGHRLLRAAEEATLLLPADNYIDYTDLEAVRLQKAILSLPRKQQLAFNMRYYDGLSYAEIADATGSTAANVKANYHAAKEKIVNYMNSND